ncbi:UMP kinase [Siculibacillus lacustris]|uniref:Uridylate kinase n=1 Tax=Siculibacillus lacustris TaxID=1549641 RepID=A0A4Q9VRF4_9HYPH|nr:UMP kinase [Siculibacillus lacustris]TBW38481.1 UMP kinase [Siculibacillus lacustris]
MGETLAWKRVILKLSGEALAGGAPFGIDPEVVGRIADDIVAATALGAEIGIVIGGGNLFRGAWLASRGTDRVTGDHMGMMATIMNALAMREALAARGLAARVLSGLAVPTVCDTFTQRDALAAFARDRVVLFAGGLGVPFLTTDTTAAMRASEMRCDAVLKATNVDGVYTADPKKDPTATRFDRLTFDEAIRRDLKVLDTAAFALARDNGIPIIVFSLQEPGALVGVLEGVGRATVVAGRD